MILVPPPTINSPGYDKVFHYRVSCRSRTFYKFFKQHLRWQFFKRLSAKMRRPPSPPQFGESVICILYCAYSQFAEHGRAVFIVERVSVWKIPRIFPCFGWKPPPLFFQVIVNRFKNLVFEVRALLNLVRGKGGVKRNGE